MVAATHLGFVASLEQLEPGAAPAAVELVLAAVGDLAALVRRGEEPVPGATVWQVGAPRAVPGSGDPQSALVRRTVTDAEGRARLFPFPGESMAVAADGAERSSPRVGVLRGELLLPLYETFRAHGTVAAEGGAEVDADGRVVVEARRGHLSATVAAVPLAPSGEWGPAPVPLADADEIVFRLELEGAVPDEERLAPVPRPGELVTIDLVARGGNATWARVLDEREEVLFDAAVTARWRAGLDSWTTVTGAPLPPEHEWAGLCPLTGLPEGVIELVASAPGYATVVFDAFRVPEPDPVTHEVVLSPAASLRGVVLHDGNPVTNFEVVYWLHPGAVQRRPFTDRADGRFEINDAPAGRLSVLASGSRLPQAETQVVETAPGSTVDLVFELPSGIPGRGRVVDAATGEPVPTALLLRRSSSSGLLTVGGRGPLEPVAPDGSFALDGLVRGQNALRIFAPEYGWSQVWRAASGDEVDFGEIPLERAQLLRVALDGVAAEERGAYSVDVVGLESLYDERFPTEGELVLGPLAPGRRYDLRLERHGEHVQQAALLAEAGRDWRVAFQVDGSRLSVAVLPEPGGTLPDTPVFVRARTQGASGVHRQISAAAVDGVATLLGVPDGEAFLDAFVAGRSAGQAVVRVSGHSDAVLQLDPTEYRFRVVDRDGRPLAGMTVYARHEALRSQYLLAGTTGERGEFTLTGLLPDRYLALAYDDVAGSTGFDLRIPKEPPAEPIELVFAPAAALVVTVTAAGEPVPGTTCRLGAFEGYLPLPDAVTDGLGSARWEHLGAGPHDVSVARAGFWPRSLRVDVSGPETSVSLELLRRADLVIDVVDRAGRAVAGADVQLEHVELGASASAWLREGLLGTSAAALATDATGRLTLPGVPRGTYRWSVPSHAGAGTFSVESDSEQRLVVE